MNSGRANTGQEWSGVVSAEVHRDYMTLQGGLQDGHQEGLQLKVSYGLRKR